jgi:intracellular multiplication protein IcmL
MTNMSDAIKRRIASPGFVESVCKRAFLAIGVSSVANLLLVFLVVFLASRPPVMHYFYTDGKDAPRVVYPTDIPYLTQAQTLRWAVDAVTAVYSVDFAHYKTQLERAAEGFDSGGWNSWASEFKRRGNLDLLQSARLIMTAVPKSAPSIRWQGVDHGTYTYRIEFPMLVRYENVQGSKHDTLRVTVIVRRTTDPRHTDGLVITELNAPLDTSPSD